VKINGLEAFSLLFSCESLKQENDRKKLMLCQICFAGLTTKAQRRKIVSVSLILIGVTQLEFLHLKNEPQRAQSSRKVTQRYILTQVATC